MTGQQLAPNQKVAIIFNRTPQPQKVLTLLPNSLQRRDQAMHGYFILLSVVIFLLHHYPLFVASMGNIIHSPLLVINMYNGALGCNVTHLNAFPCLFILAVCPLHHLFIEISLTF